MAGSLRLDKWLWFARLFKTRGQAQKAIEGGEVTINGRSAAKCAQSIKPGDVVVFPAGPYRRQVRVVALGTRRGPAPEARALYADAVFVDPPLSSSANLLTLR